MQLHTAVNDEKSETSPGNLTDIASTMEGLKETLLIRVRNATTSIRNSANGLPRLAMQ